jgi:bifunctional non-homologous end joining protein LigD
MLDEYEKKRDFGRTPEPPPGDAPGDAGALTFVVQKHAARRLHYDFRLELDGVLKSWAVPKGPSLDPTDKRLAVLVEDHPLDYASFEGVIPRGEYGAGQVIVWDAGTYSPDEGGRLSSDDRAEAAERTRAGLARGKLSFTLRGEKMQGSWTLVKSRIGEKEWLLIKHEDEFADPQGDLLADGRSVRTGRTVEDLGAALGEPAAPAGASTPPDLRATLEGVPGARRGPFPRPYAPMLPSLASKPFSHPDWVFEPKLDGVRALAFVQGGRARLLARSGIETTGQYPVLAAEIGRGFRGDVILDGEIVALDDDGRPSFHRLAHRIHLQAEVDVRRAEAEIPLVYYAFDLLYLDGYDLRSVPLERRKRLLEEQLGAAGFGRIVLLPHFEGDGEIAFHAAVEHGFEGVVAKRRGSAYETGRRSPRWLKVKGTSTEDFVIGAYSRGTGNRADTFGALLVGTIGANDQLEYVAHVGTGFDDRLLRELLAQLEPLQSPTCPFTVQPPLKGPTTWVQPVLVAEVKYDQRTPDGSIRSPVFVRLRPDKLPQEAMGSDAEPVEPAAVAVLTDESGTEEAVDRASTPPLHAETEPETCAGRGAGSEAGSPVPLDYGAGSLGTSTQDALDQLAQAGNNLLLEVGGQRIGLTNLDKELWPATERRALTKRDLIAYYAAMAPYLLPHLRDRPLTLIRLPNGIGGQRFYQKHGEELPEFVEMVRHYSKQVSGDQDYLLCNNLPTLLWLGQVAAIELHSSYCRINPEPDAQHLSKVYAGSRENYMRSLLNFPDFVVFDLDPYIYAGTEAPGEEPQLNREAFAKTSETALWLKEILDGLSLRGFLKTTGRTGLHIYVPIRRDLDYDASRALAESITGYLARSHPTDVTVEWSVPRRTGRVFADYNQNARAKTLASIYSPRGTPEASVSVPLGWDELGRVYPTDFTILDVPERLRQLGDLWAGILDAKHDLKALADRVP